MITLFLCLSSLAGAEVQLPERPAALTQSEGEKIIKTTRDIPASLWALQGGAATLTAVATTPLAFWLGEAWGGAFANVYVAVLPALVMIVLVPPIAVTAALMATSRWLAPEKVAWKSTLLALSAVQVVALVGAGYFHMWAGDRADLFKFAAVDALLLGGTAALTTFVF